MLITAVVMFVGTLIMLLVSVDVVRRRVVVHVPALAQRHLVWVIVGLAMHVAACYLQPVYKIIVRL